MARWGVGAVIGASRRPDKHESGRVLM
jgi:hypothetical protein